MSLLTIAGPVSAEEATGVGTSAATTMPAATFTPVNVPGTIAMDAAPQDLLRKYGYVEQEYYVTGTACRYRITNRSPLPRSWTVAGGTRRA